MNEYLEQAEKFLADTATELKVEFKEFGSMSWDTDGQKRNIFNVTLLREDGKSYSFEFGDSINNSCGEDSNKWEEMDETEEIEVFVGISYKGYKSFMPSGYYTTNKYELLNKREEVVSYMSKKFKDIVELEIHKHNNQPKNKHDKFENTTFRLESSAETVERAINRKIDELKGEVVTSQKQKEGEILIPDAYSILACLNPGYYESADEVYEMFGEMKPSQAEAIYQEDKAIRELFNEQELEMLHEIC